MDGNKGWVGTIKMILGVKKVKGGALLNKTSCCGVGVDRGRM